jgi:hypothetical protein
MRKSFNLTKLDQAFVQVAPARQRSSACQVVSTSGQLLTAITGTKPPDTLSVFSSIATDNGQSTKAARCEINKLGHVAPPTGDVIKWQVGVEAPACCAL